MSGDRLWQLLNGDGKHVIDTTIDMQSVSISGEFFGDEIDLLIKYLQILREERQQTEKVNADVNKST